jgi:GNAT superfamily N-acetyltransferase
MYTGIQTMELEISPIKPSDVNKALELVSEAAMGEMGFPLEALCHYRDIIVNVLNGQSKGHLFLGCKKNEDLIGLLICLPPEGGVATILWLVVAPKYKGQGIGTQLFNMACQWAKDNGCHKIKLTASTTTAVHFYEKQGMKVEGSHRDHWWHLDFWSLGKFL